MDANEAGGEEISDKRRRTEGGTYLDVAVQALKLHKVDASTAIGVKDVYLSALQLVPDRRRVEVKGTHSSTARQQL